MLDISFPDKFQTKFQILNSKPLIWLKIVENFWTYVILDFFI